MEKSRFDFGFDRFDDYDQAEKAFTHAFIEDENDIDKEIEYLKNEEQIISNELRHFMHTEDYLKSEKFLSDVHQRTQDYRINQLIENEHCQEECNMKIRKIGKKLYNLEQLRKK